MIGAAIRALAALTEKVVAAMLAGLVLLTLWQVFARYVLGAPDPTSDEVIRVLLVWFGLLAGAWCVATRAHIGFDLLVSRLPESWAGRVEWLVRALIALVALWGLVWGGIRLVALAFALDQRTPVLGLPMGGVYCVIPLAGVLIVLFLFIRPDERDDARQVPTT